MPDPTLRHVCVYCGSSDGRDPRHAASAERLGATLARRGIALVYGGGQVGLMGRVADAVLAAGGRAVGVIPRFLMERELAHVGLTELRVTESMHERKAVMASMAQAFVALPGGFGTLEELTETLTWGQLGLHARPVGLLDPTGYFDDLRRFADRMVEEGFLRPAHRDLLLVAKDADDLLDRMERAARAGPPGRPIPRI
jgi:uncharacterized protein (TIGR00730 family)